MGRAQFRHTPGQTSCANVSRGAGGRRCRRVRRRQQQSTGRRSGCGPGRGRTGSLVEVDDSNRFLLAERKIRAGVHGTDLIERIEVIRNNTEVCTYRGDGEDVEFEWVDQQDLTRIALQRTVRGRSQTCYYYLRITQADGQIAWTSPIWFTLRQVSLDSSVFSVLPRVDIA